MGSRRRRTNSAIPVRRKNSQNTGAVYATAASNPLRARAPIPTSTSATAPWARIAFAGSPVNAILAQGAVALVLVGRGAGALAGLAVLAAGIVPMWLSLRRTPLRRLPRIEEEVFP